MGSTIGSGSRGGGHRADGAAGEEALDRWPAMTRGGPVGKVLDGVAVEGDGVLCAAR